MSDSAVRAEIKQACEARRTFAIISHPDAGKTTLTEKLLLYSGMIRAAGMVGGRKNSKTAASDWMSMEQERGISITASAMQFNYRDTVINVIDTPGHQDFSEDTYRSLTAADSVIMVLDAAKGIETQTLKLFDACRLRGIPVITFINKMDLPPRDPLDLMAEVEEQLGIQASAFNWPIGVGQEFSGVVKCDDHVCELYKKTAAAGQKKADVTHVPLSELAQHVPEHLAEQVGDELELLSEAGNPFTVEAYRNFEVTPVFFGSAMNNFGVEPLFDALVDIAPCPHARPADQADDEISVDPIEEPFSAYVFKMQANMNPKHRDCVAFLRINTGRYEKDLQVKHQRLGKRIRLSRPHNLMVNGRETVDFAYPGDIIGVINNGTFAIGDTVTSKGDYTFKPLPAFQPELFARIRPKDLGKRKAIDKGLVQLVSEGAVQLLREYGQHAADPFIAAVGQLQFEVMQHRLSDEYGVDTELQMLPYTASAWLIGDPDSFQKPFNAVYVLDNREQLMVLFRDEWEKQHARRENPDHQLVDHA